MTEPRKVQSRSFGEVLAEGQAKAKEAKEEFDRNGGMCLNCGKNPGDHASTLNTMHCTECNDKTAELLKGLGPGFVGFSVLLE